MPRLFFRIRQPCYDLRRHLGWRYKPATSSRCVAAISKIKIATDLVKAIRESDFRNDYYWSTDNAILMVGSEHLQAYLRGKKEAYEALRKSIQELVKLKFHIMEIVYSPINFKKITNDCIIEDEKIEAWNQIQRIKELLK